ncbi:phosphotransferase [Thiomicrorhabdus arctica]|uniref:phosphotransferase n=1 Tax=Thiomicrorhabdus arctica TaxID=131540 RepID=UPI000361A3B3|nr:phosphotransferase [Thiomicrorhabdus arctica]
MLISVSMNRSLPATLLSQIAVEHQAVLKECHTAALLPRLFADSTHQVWSCLYGYDSEELNCVLKVCSVEGVRHSPFWQAMQQLFSFDFAHEMGRYGLVYQHVKSMTPLKIPRLIAAGSANKVNQSGFLLTEFVDGKVIEPNKIGVPHIEQLAHHLAALHQSTQIVFGPLYAPQLSIDLWGDALAKTLKDLSRAQNIDLRIADDIIRQIASLEIDAFYPIMPDLRWDQFLVTDDGVLNLIDLDGLVWGPRELELVLIEYLLDPSQLDVFKAVYTRSHVMPDLDSVRDVYRLLLFVMNVLGESDLEKWMGHPVRFK